jgi:hypothetical protein
MAGFLSSERQKAYALFCDRIDRDDESLRPSALPFRYDLCLLIDRVVWRIPGVELMINEELRELTNEMNRWKLDLRRWNAWADVLDECPVEAAWNLRVEFVEALVFLFVSTFCHSRQVNFCRNQCRSPSSNGAQP